MVLIRGDAMAPHFTKLIMWIVAAMLIPVSVMAAQPEGTPVATPGAAAASLIFEPQTDQQLNYFDIELEPGEQSTLAIAIGNGGIESLDVITYAADGYTIRNGGFGLLDSTAEDTGVTTWLDYPDERLTLAPNEVVAREFAVTVPEGVAPGQYITGIALETADPVDTGEQAGMFQFEQYVRSVRAIRITVPGPVTPALEIGQASIQQDGGVPSIEIEVKNTGNVQLSPEGEIEVSDEDGQLLLSAPVQMGPVYAGHATTIWLGLSESVPEGDYRINVELRDESQNVTAMLDDAELTVAVSGTPTARAPIAIASATFEPGPSDDNVQFAVVDATISNTGEPVTNAQLSLLVFKDGDEVERFPISQSLALPQGDTSVNTRYIPLEGWSSGEWSFELLLETVDPNGAAVVVASQPIEQTITIP